MSNPLEAFAKERQRQIEQEGWTAEHDDEHTDGSLAAVAACYAFAAAAGVAGPLEVPIMQDVPSDVLTIRRMWPQSWDTCWWKPKNKRRNLERAGALIVAELERMDRAGE